MLEFIAWVFGCRRCPCCERYSRHTKRRRLNTAYVDDKQNFLKSCRDCYQDAYEHYADLWSDYYGSRL